jgi:hypothetical protein
MWRQFRLASAWLLFVLLAPAIVGAATAEIRPLSGAPALWIDGRPSTGVMFFAEPGGPAGLRSN